MKYLILLPFGELVVGPYRGSMHCTLMYWFTWKDPEIAQLCDYLDKSKQMFLSGSGIELVSEKRVDTFGPEQQTSVYVLAYNPVLHAFHQFVKQFLDEKGVVYSNPAWVGAGFTPHVTLSPRGEFLPGMRHHVSQLALLCDTAGSKYIAHVT